MQLTQYDCKYYLHESGRCELRENCMRCHAAGRCEFCINRYTDKCNECEVKDVKKARGILPTRRQKVIMSKAGLVPDNWLVIVETDVMLQMRSKRTGRIQYIVKTT